MIRNSTYTFADLTSMKSVFVFLLLLSLTSCSSKRNLLTDSITKSSNVKTADYFMNQLEASQVDYTWFSGSGQGKIDFDGQRYSVRFNVRILRDSVIWLQIQKLGFEIARMMITPDSAWIINRWEKFYSEYDTREFLAEYNLPADFEMFTKVFTAGAYVPDMIDTTALDGDGSLVLKTGHGVHAWYWFEAPTAMLSRSIIRDHLEREWFSAYSDYRLVEGGAAIPYTRSNSLTMDGETSIMDLEYTDIEVNVPLEFPFSIPSHYEKL